MANKKINELDSRASLSLSDLLAVGDPTTGYLYKITITDLKSLTGAGVISFNGRVGAVSPAEGDYTLTQLGDVIITSAASGNLVRYNGSNWVNSNLQSSDVTGALSYTPANDSLVVHLAGTETITGTKTFAPSHSNGVNAFVAGGYSASQVKVTYGANVNDITLAVGDSFSVVRVGTGVPSMYASLGLNFYGSYIGVYGTHNGTANPPGEIRLAGNYGFGTAAFGAYNTAVSSLTFGNSYNSYQYNQIVYARNTVWMHNDASTQPTYSAAAIMNLQSTTKGFVMPRMTTTQRDAIASPIAGLEIYNSSTNKPNYYNGSTWLEPGAISSIALTVPTGFAVTGSPLTSSGTLGLTFDTGYSLPTTAKQSNWDDAYTFVAAFPTQTGNSGKYLTTDGSALSWATVSSYSLPVATASVLGGVKIGSGVSVDAAGVISVSTNYQAPLSGTGFVKISGTTISYDNSSYLTTASAASTYLALSGGTLTGGLTGTTATFSGNVNIGASATTGKRLIVNQTGTTGYFLSGEASGTEIAYWYYDATTIQFSSKSSTRALAFFTQDIERMRIATNGNVIINPSGLSVQTLAGQIVNKQRSDSTTPYLNGIVTMASSSSTLFQIYYDANVGIHILGATYYTGADGGAYKPMAFFTSDLERMRITNGGSVLIGTTSGVSGGGALQVNGDVNINGNFKINGTTIGGGGGSGVTGSGTSGYVTKWTGSTTLGNGIVYDTGTRIGINTSSPAGIVDIRGGSGGEFIFNSYNAGYNIRFEAGDQLNFYSDFSKTPTIGYINYEGAATYISRNLYIEKAVGTKVTIKASGNILVGTTTDLGGDYKLQVNGAISMAYGYIFNLKGSGSDILIANTGSTMSITGAMSVSSSVTASAFYESSDIRFKNVLAYNPEVNVSGIDVIKFTRKSDSQIRYGYSAQQVQSIFPDVVVGENELVVNYIDVHTLKIAALEKRVAELEAKLN